MLSLGIPLVEYFGNTLVRRSRPRSPQLYFIIVLLVVGSRSTPLNFPYLSPLGKVSR